MLTNQEVMKRPLSMRGGSLICVALLCASRIATAQDPAADQRQAFVRLADRVYAEVINGFYAAVPFPNSEGARAMREQIKTLQHELAALPCTPNLRPIDCVEKDRLLAFLHIAEARFYEALSASGEQLPGIDYGQERLRHAHRAQSYVESALHWLDEALRSSANPAELERAIENSEVRDHLNALSTTAQSIVWVLTRTNEAKAAAKSTWEKISGDFRRQYYPPAPEVIETLDLDPKPAANGAMTPIAWTGIGLILLGLVSAIFVSGASLFQQWAIRVVFAMGAAMAGTVITGLLKIDLPAWGVVAGGALAIIVLIYLVNPPKIE